MTYKYYVVYETKKLIGSVFRRTDTKYDTEETIISLSEYISATYCNGDTVVILNLILLNEGGEQN